VTLDDGTVLTEEVAFPPGHDKNPLTDDQLAQKFHGLADPVIGRDHADVVYSRLAQLENDSTPHTVLEHIQLPTRG
jgi:2-methylcitrate dehydratase